MNITEIAKEVEKNGGRLYLVGGAIRDAILNRPVCDEDYCVVGILKEDFVKIFPNAFPRGKAFEVFDIEGKEFALARTEVKNGKGHKEFEIKTGKNITIEEDLKRRDITINAIAKDVLTDKIVDPFNGIEDITNKKIKAVSNKFSEDPLRVYRVARIASQLNFEVDEQTYKLMKTLKSELDTLPKERVFIELKKALSTEKPSVFFNVLKKANVLDVHFNEINNLVGSLQPKKYHPEGDSYNHTMLALNNCAQITKKLEIRYGTLVHDLGKGITPKAMYPHHFGHDEKGVELVKELSNRIGVPVIWKKCGMTAAKEHMKGGIFYKMTVPKQVQFLERIDKSMIGIKGLQLVVYSDRARIKEEDIINSRYNFERIGTKMMKQINGDYIKEKYNTNDGIEIKKRLHQERVKWLKNQKTY